MALSNLKPLRKRLLSENVVGAIRTAIFDGDLKLGQRLVETEIADQLGVSRGPVREALRLLAAEGMVLINVHRGTFVVKPTPADVEEIYTLRESLEELAIRRVVDLATDKEINSLDDALEKFQAASRQKKVRQMVGLNTDFHQRLFRLARHKRLAQLWSTLESQIRLCNSLEIERTPEDVSRMVRDHAEILKAIRQRDAATACRLMSQHIAQAARAVQQAMDPSSRKKRRRAGA